MVEQGDLGIALSGEILRTVVGSGVHGLAIEGTDDHDEMGIYIEPVSQLLGVEQRMDHYIYRTQPEGARSGPGDVDLTMYSLGKFLSLAMKGNPTVLLPLFAPEESVLKVTPWGESLRDIRTKFLSKEAGERFLGYMHGQHQRMLGHEKRNVPNRPELVEKYGYDTKYASHALRLAFQGLEVVRRGTLTLPMPGVQRSMCLQVKKGEWEIEEVSEMIQYLEGRVRHYLDHDTPLPDKPDMTFINEWAVQARLGYHKEYV